ncbi:methylated-DNA--[protein]-cysteine S-methyltransferase [Cutibacterium sp.]|uniref:methylated-DNA--[protein]-cysteine S-methyltransferase n=1 Tax=Cutibacterium sp. TaxID=1912221 RepID=UPI0026DAF84B|nr:methylated-DNA--[protein]-cysteine S-methyltransferase [Cutibacterium sp.]MDO4413257.1 methylated-DNA--[protein]-cysteine S-methyltransferase [Cutibacterium sp.]
MAIRHLDTPIGELTLTATPNGLLQVSFPTAPTPLGIPEPSEQHDMCEAILDATARQISEYFSRSRAAFDLPLDLSTVTPFRRLVLNGLLSIPYAQTISYRDLAALIGHPRAARAVGNACATNPLPIVIPCHRVLRSDGGLGGYLGGPVIKRFLVDLETRQPRLPSPAIETDQVPSRQHAANPNCSRTVKAAEH